MEQIWISTLVVQEVDYLVCCGSHIFLSTNLSEMQSKINHNYNMFLFTYHWPQLLLVLLI